MWTSATLMCLRGFVCELNNNGKQTSQYYAQMWHQLPRITSEREIHYQHSFDFDLIQRKGSLQLQYIYKASTFYGGFTVN